MAGLPKIDIEYAKKIFEQHGCKLLEKVWPGAKSPISYKCKCGTKAVTCWNNFTRGHRCKACFLKRFAAGKKKKVENLKMRERLFTVTQAADILGVTGSSLFLAIRYWKTIPAPTRTCGVSPKRFYNEKDIRAISKLID